MFGTIFDRYVFDTGEAMANTVLSNYSVCSGGGHIHFNHQTDGAGVLSCQLDENQTMTPLTDDEKILMTQLSLRQFATGKTWAQVKTAVQTGMTFKV